MINEPTKQKPVGANLHPVAGTKGERSSARTDCGMHRTLAARPPDSLGNEALHASFIKIQDSIASIEEVLATVGEATGDIAKI